MSVPPFRTTSFPVLEQIILLKAGSKWQQRFQSCFIHVVLPAQRQHKWEHLAERKERKRKAVPKHYIFSWATARGESHTFYARLIGSKLNSVQLYLSPNNNNGESEEQISMCGEAVVWICFSSSYWVHCMKLRWNQWPAPGNIYHIPSLQ